VRIERTRASDVIDLNDIVKHDNVKYRYNDTHFKYRYNDTHFKYRYIDTHFKYRYIDTHFKYRYIDTHFKYRYIDTHLKKYRYTFFLISIIYIDTHFKISICPHESFSKKVVAFHYNHCFQRKSEEEKRCYWAVLIDFI